jgi:hypothetical protein
MGEFDRTEVLRLAAICEDHSNSRQIRGKAFEDLTAHLFESCGGVTTYRNVLSAHNEEEVDLFIMNSPKFGTLDLLPTSLLVECKNWTAKVSGQQLDSLKTKLDERGIDTGVLFAANGITGGIDPLMNAYSKITTFLNLGVRIVVITMDDVKRLTSAAEFRDLLHKRLGLLLATRMCVLD